MKFSLKLLLCTVIVLAIALGFSGFYFVNYVFDTSLGREVGQAVDENSILCFAFETAALNVPAKYDVLQDHTVEQIASNLEAGGLSSNRMLRLSDEEKNKLYASDGFETDDGLLMQTDVTTKTYRTIFMNDHYYIQTGSTVNALDRVLYLETLRDVSEVFNERELGFRVFRQVTVIMLILGTVTMHLIASWLTKPIRLLTRATKRMAAGDYDYRARQVSNDELGQLTLDFNHMAEALEENINKLEDEIQAKEDFVGAFAHELKTPLTAISGYSELIGNGMASGPDVLRFAAEIHKSANRLLMLIDDTIRLSELDTSDKQIPFEKIDLYVIVKNCAEMLQFKAEERNVRLTVDGGACVIEGDRQMLEELVYNLCDNAVCYNNPGGSVMITVRREEGKKMLRVKDTGIGIPEEHQERIFERFYRVDKSRSKSTGGTGLGLAIVKHIVAVHHAQMTLYSEPGKGTEIGIVFE